MSTILNNKISEYLKDQPDCEIYVDEVDRNFVEHCFHGQTQFPERRAGLTIVEHAQRLVNFKVQLKKRISKINAVVSDSDKLTGDIDEVVNNEFNSFRESLKAKYLDMLNAESKCISWHVTGPARFPVAKAQSANERARKISEMYFSHSEYIIKKVIKRLFPNGDGSTIRMSNENAVEELKAAINAAETAHNYMKIANRLVSAAYKKAENGELTDCQAKELEQKMLDKGIPLDKLNIYLEPNPIMPTWGRFSLQNSNANIRRLKVRLAEAEALKETRNSNALEGELDNGIKFGIVDGRIAIWLGGKPPKEVTQALRKFALKFSPSRNNAWVRAHTINAENAFHGSILPYLKTLETSTFS